MSRLLRSILLTMVFVAAGTEALLAQEWIADIKAAPSRFVNREVRVVGQVLASTPSSPGASRGAYTVADQSDPDGISVRTLNLPAPGEEFEVEGTVVQDPATGEFLIDEIGRSPAGRPAWLIPALAGLGLLVLILLWMLVRSLGKDSGPRSGTRRSKSRRSVPPTAAKRVRPKTPTTPKASMKPATTPPGAVPKPPPAPAVPKPSDSQKTELYRNLGASLRITEGPDKGKEFPIGKLITLIGREGRRDNDITLTDTSVSREQAKLLYDEGEKEFTLVNESKTNPTRVDGEQVETRRLEDGAQIEMGRTAAKLERE